MANSNSNQLDATSKNLTPIVEVIDDWYTANNLGLIFNAKINESRLLVSGIDLLNCKKNRTEARQLLHSLEKYMAGKKINSTPKINIAEQKK